MTIKKHTIKPIKTAEGYTYITIEWDDVKKNLSITGVEGPKANGNAFGSCGQIIMHEWDVTEYCEGYDFDIVARIRDVWNRYHLNYMQAGSPAQMAWLEANPITDRMNYYTAATGALAAAGLNPDPNYIHNGKPYKYGHAWLRIEVPQDVIDWLFSLPADDTLPSAWR